MTFNCAVRGFHTTHILGLYTDTYIGTLYPRTHILGLYTYIGTLYPRMKIPVFMFPRLGTLFPGSFISTGLLFLWSFFWKLFWQSQLYFGKGGGEGKDLANRNSGLYFPWLFALDFTQFRLFSRVFDPSILFPGTFFFSEIIV